MKNLVQLLCMIFLLTFSSCSSVVERNPAEVENELFTEVFSFPSHAIDSKTDFAADFKAIIDPHIENYENNRSIEYVKSKSLQTGTAFKVEMAMDPISKRMVYRVVSAPNAFKDRVATAAVGNFIMSTINNYQVVGNSFAFMEMYFNAQSGDPLALNNFLKIRNQQAQVFNLPTASLITEEELSKYRDLNLDLRKKISDEIKVLLKKRSASEKKRKSILDSLDSAPEGKQFRALIAKNDRKGAMNVLKKYLPWEDMAVFEKQFWENYIAITENPVPIDQRVLIYRGLEDDYIHRAGTGAKELTEKEAIQQNKAFIMASGMVKNQGSWNRRLRSLEAMNKKFIGTIAGNDEYAQSARISVMFSNHAQEPKGSPFISFTPVKTVAERFGSWRVSSYLMDPRLLNYNYAGIKGEVEFLVPLTTFPDEMVGIADITLLNEEDVIHTKFQHLEEKLKQLLNKKYGEGKGPVVLEKIKKNSKDFFSDVYIEGYEVKAAGVPAANKKFYKKFLTDKDPIQPMKSNGEISCKDIMQLFWMAN